MIVNHVLQLFEMPQWAAPSLVWLCLSFLMFLALINGASFAMGKLVRAVPFEIVPLGYELNLTDVSVWNLPVYVEKVPPMDGETIIDIWCGDDLQEEEPFRGRRYALDSFSVCENLKIRVSPTVKNMGVWVRGNSPRRCVVAFCTRALFLCVIAVGFYVMFQKGNNNSVMRSVLITQTSVILILDPLKLISTFFPSILFLHVFVSCIGWWRTVVEIFAEYGPLVRIQKASVYRNLAAIPTVLLLFSHFLYALSVNWTVIGFFGGVGVCMLPIAALVFLVKARRVSGMKTLVVHIVSGAMAMTVAYLVNVLRLIDDDFRESLFCDTVEISFVSAYAMFQTIFHFGGSTPKTHAPPPQSTFNRCETIDGMLDTMGDFDSSVKFMSSPFDE